MPEITRCRGRRMSSTRSTQALIIGTCNFPVEAVLFESDLRLPIRRAVSLFPTSPSTSNPSEERELV